ncbi:MAG: T9SS type A sorting domain-containing protein [Sporocytophaga sp.]|uniref:T9SS type A sorting domain-containing protein n=1 Tax=Sporocytophaga sp. TaxID=2231183 RepID=UPI001B07E3B9|nr:T9SS type A sorting domain-containing protein [Sporocytophaga sp.]MBO9701907.1 T9SS type A sorting domain-containing protein [Sporocytophaga sp.]
MKKYLFLILFFLGHWAISQKLEWARTIHVQELNPGYQYESQIFDLQIDKQGDILFSGAFLGDTLYLDEVNKLFRSKALPYPTDPNYVNFITKLDRDGKVKWGKETGFTYQNILYHVPARGVQISLDSLDNVSLGTEFYPMAKLRANGSLLFAKDSSNLNSSENFRASDNNGNTYVFRSTSDFFKADYDYGPKVKNLPNDFSICFEEVCTEVALAKYDSYGNLIWVTRVSPRDFTYEKSIILDSQKNIYLLFSRNFKDYLAKFDNNGGKLWEKSVGDASSITIHNSRIYTEGEIYDLDGTVIGNLLFGSNEGNAVVECFSIDNTGRYVLGKFSGTVDFDPGVGVQSFTSASEKGYLAKYDLEGNLEWVHALSFLVLGAKINIDSTGNIIIIGEIQNESADLDFSAEQHIVTASPRAFFIAKYSQPKEKSPQFISWDQIGDKTIEDKEIEINATGGASGNPVRLSIATIPSSGVATINGNIITVLGPGDVTVWASQDGNDDYFVAFDLSQTFNISVVSSLSTIAKEQINVFPNPLKDEFFISGNLRAINSIELTDLQGKAVSFNKELSNENLKVSLKANKSGIYLLKVYTDEKVEYRKITIE